MKSDQQQSRDEGPVWEPHVQELKKFTRSFSRDNMAKVVPLDRVSTTLEDVKRNSESLMLSAHSTFQKLRPPSMEGGILVGEPKKVEPLTVSKETSTFVKPGTPRRGYKKQNQRGRKMRRARSDNTIVKPKVSEELGPPTYAKDTFEWFSSFGSRKEGQESSQLFSFQLPSASELQEQAKLVHSKSAQHFERMAATLMTKPKEALSSAQQTLSNCQQNLQLLQVSLQQSFSEGRAVVEHRMQALGEPGSPFTSGERLQEILVQDRERDAMDDMSPTSVADEDGDASAKRPLGPFQRQVQKRREHASKRLGSSLKEDGRQITIVTTASLPWMTGTAVNPLLRAAYLAKDGSKSVNLMVPWLAKSDQERVFPNGMTFDSPQEQEVWVRDWLKKRTGFCPDFQLTFYPGRYAPEKCSILPVGDPTKYVPDSAADVAILEEPEHLTWYHHGKRWTDKFSHVVGVVHTNYLDYARREEGGSNKELLLRHINSWVTRIHCHKVVKLSDAVQDLPRQTTEFVHGVAESFLKVGEKKASSGKEGTSRFSKGAYFLGKCVWAKGYTELINLMSENKDKLADDLTVDCFGTGEDLPAVKSESERKHLGLHFMGARDHLDESLHDYKVFVNPSTSDVVATTSAEALAMGKWVVCADHPSNAFFSQFQNCLIYRNSDEFVKHMQYALTHDPAPMTGEDRARLTWEAATERFLNVSELTEKDISSHPISASIDTAAWFTHNTLCGVESLRAAAGAGINTKDNPESLLDYKPHASGGGMFDRTL
ncbi:Digalactosyldiacylglycerol synthase 1 [Picochlorum sp. SENEW3]|nr:Digalactosyldiacylglycerol synthase 1 [Picochlorum sp. SENEW3]WPT17340.1 Digalactosyldiacylglycerol synthase 1 [Picochlorum sp. SENEW3]